MFVLVLHEITAQPQPFARCDACLCLLQPFCPAEQAAKACPVVVCEIKFDDHVPGRLPGTLDFADFRVQNLALNHAVAHADAQINDRHAILRRNISLSKQQALLGGAGLGRRR